MLRKTILTILVGFFLIITIYVVDTINSLKNNNISFENSAIIYNDLEKNLVNNKFSNNIEKLKIINDIENYLSKCEYEYRIYIEEIFNISNQIIKLSAPNSNRESCYEYIVDLAFIALSIFPEKNKTIESFFIKLLDKHFDEYKNTNPKYKEKLIINFSKKFNNKNTVLEKNEKSKTQLMKF